MLIDVLLVTDLVLFIVFLGLLLWYFREYRDARDAELQSRLDQLEGELEEGYKRRHEKSIKSQRGIISGKILERFTALSSNYPYNLRDVVPVFRLFDYIVFNGASDGKVREVILQEMKTGTSQPNSLEADVRRCVRKGLVRWESWRHDGEQWFSEEFLRDARKRLKDGATPEEIAKEWDSREMYGKDEEGENDEGDNV